MPKFEIRPGVELGASIRTYELKPDDPMTRPLRVYAVDPSVHRSEGSIATIQVPYEPLFPGPVGKIFEVESADGEKRYSPLDLENPHILISNGLAPSVSNPAFHQQMVYAVASSAYATFRSALGRLIAWGADEKKLTPHGGLSLKLRPHVASEGANASYDKATREIRFGYAEDKNFPGGRVFACLSHDVIIHELTHAVIDGLRSHFTIPTNPDVLGFHEGLSDLIAVFHHFLYPDVLESQIRKVGPSVEHSKILTQIAANFGFSTIGSEAVRFAEGREKQIKYRPDLEAHEMGNVLVSAMFSAFIKIFRRKTERYLRLAGSQQSGYWSEDLVKILADKANDLARNFLMISIRALDYCPPVDLELGEYLRALITADYNLIPSDPWGYRETLISSFAEFGIYPKGVMSLSEDALLWRPPKRRLPLIPKLSFSELRFNGDPSIPASAQELRRQAAALGEYVTRPDICDEFGLATPDSLLVEIPCIQSIRTSRRVGPDGQVLFDLVAEVTQRRMADDPITGNRAKFFGGSTIIVGPRGEVRYIISKNIKKHERIERQLKFQKHSDFWEISEGRYRLTDFPLSMIHKKKQRI